MSIQAEEKLIRRYKLSERIAHALVLQGYPTPQLIKTATDEELLALRGLTSEDVAEIRAKVK